MKNRSSSTQTTKAQAAKQWNARIPESWREAVRKTSALADLNQEEFAIILLSLAFEVDGGLKNPFVNDGLARIRKAAKLIGVAEKLPLDVLKEMERARRFELPTFTLARGEPLTQNMRTLGQEKVGGIQITLHHKSFNVTALQRARQMPDLGCSDRDAASCDALGPPNIAAKSGDGRRLRRSHIQSH